MKYTKLSYSQDGSFTKKASRRLQTYLSKIVNKRLRYRSKIAIKRDKDIEIVSIKGIYD